MNRSYILNGKNNIIHIWTRIWSVNSNFWTWFRIIKWNDW